MGDAAATAHFSIGSGTKLALESAIALADYVAVRADARGRVREIRGASAASRCCGCNRRRATRWNGSRRSSAISISIRCSSTIRCSRARSASATRTCGCATRPGWKARRPGSSGAPARRPTSCAGRCSRPIELRDLKLKNRVVVSPMDQYKAVDGCPTDWHFVHYAERAKGGAGLVYIEMTCVSPEGRISPGCTGLYAPEHEAAWKRIVDFVHRETEAKICCQLGHSGAKGSTQLGWEEMDAPLADGQLAADLGLGRPLVGAQPDPEGDGPRRHGPRHGGVRRRRRDGGARRLRHAGAALRARLSALVLHHAAHQRRAPTNMAAASRTACAIRSRCFARCARSGRRKSRSRCASPPTTGSATAA